MDFFKAKIFFYTSIFSILNAYAKCIYNHFIVKTINFIADSQIIISIGISSQGYNKGNSVRLRPIYKILPAAMH